MSAVGPCPEWEYANHPQRSSILPIRVREVLVDLRRGRVNSRDSSRDTRSVHHRIFVELTPTGFEYFAGHYRGEDFPCLRDCRVGIASDPRVGSAPDLIHQQMQVVANVVDRELASLDAAHQAPNAVIDPALKILNAVIVACRIQEMVFRIHPYKNGNGHMARFVIWSVCGRYGYWPKRWIVEPRPPDPPYTQLIVEYRNGNPEPLEQFVLQSILG
jgi:hypothetical protein